MLEELPSVTFKIRTANEFENDDIQREDVVKEVLEIYSGNIPPNYNNIEDIEN